TIRSSSHRGQNSSCCSAMSRPRKPQRWCATFFFQAEDGIRDKLVTGVQTCALPILVVSLAVVAQPIPDWFPKAPLLPAPTGEIRSEERRVGKECRARRTA